MVLLIQTKMTMHDLSRTAAAQGHHIADDVSFHHMRCLCVWKEDLLDVPEEMSSRACLIGSPSVLNGRE
jgi:hypothetical protein